MTSIAQSDPDAARVSVDEVGGKYPMSINDNSIVIANREVLYCDLSEGVVILDLNSGVYYGLDAVGAYIWKLIQEPKTLRDISLAVQESYDVERWRCEQDLRNLLAEMTERNLIEVRNKAT